MLFTQPHHEDAFVDFANDEPCPVLDPDTGTRVAAVLPWPGQPVDRAGCLAEIGTAFGPSLASTMVVLPLAAMPLTEQGKPNRPEIRRLGRELAAREAASPEAGRELSG